MPTSFRSRSLERDSHLFFQRQERVDMKNSTLARKNYLVGLLFSLLSGIVMYAEKVVFVSHFSLKYVGLSSLFENIFLIISAFDMGVNSYLVSYLVKAVREKDEARIRGSLSVVRRYYYISSAIVFFLGFIISFFIPVLTKNEVERASTLYFLIYLIGALSQYYFGSRILLLLSFERSYIVSMFVQGGRIVQYLLSILLILKTDNYLFYILLGALATSLTYLLLYIKCGHLYLFIKEKKKKIVKREKERVEYNIGGMIVHRTSIVFFRSFDTILVSLFFGASLNGLYSNYVLLLSAFLTPFWVFQATLTPSIALRYFNNSKEENMAMYKRCYYLNFLFSLLLSLVFLFVVRFYIVFSYGESYLLPSSFDSVFAFILFLSSSRTTSLIFRDIGGIYTYDWKKPLGEILLTLLFSLLFKSTFGLIGIPLSFVLSYVVLVIWLENRTVIKNVLFDLSWLFVAKESFLLSLGLAIIALLGAWWG